MITKMDREIANIAMNRMVINSADIDMTGREQLDAMAKLFTQHREQAVQEYIERHTGIEQGLKCVIKDLEKRISSMAENAKSQAETHEVLIKRLERAEEACAPLLEALERLIKNYAYRTPAGTTNCRYCDVNTDDYGTCKDRCEDECEIRLAKQALAAHEQKGDPR